MATFEQRASGWWQAKIRRAGHKAQSKTFPVKKDAEKWATAIEAKMDAGQFFDLKEAEATTLEAALDKYQSISAKKNGHNQEKYRIKAWKAHPLAKRSLASLKPSDFAKWLDERLENAAISTAQKDLAVISHLFTVAAKQWDLPVINPILKVDIPTEDNSRERRLEEDENNEEENEENKILKELTPLKGRGKTRSIWMVPLVKFALETACRQSELVNAKWKDLAKTGDYLRIKGKKRKNGKHSTKNGARFRDVPLSKAARKILADLPKIENEDRIFPISSAVVKYAFAQAVKRAKIEDLTFHDLRHEATSRLAEKLALHELMKVTGHESTKMLARYYHPRASDLAKKLG